MNPRLAIQLTSAIVFACWNVAAAGEACRRPPPGMVRVPAGRYVPLFRGENDPKDTPVSAFFLDVFPVTNGDFLEFVRANPKWRRSQVKRLFADEDYLKQWVADLELGTN